MFSNVQHVPMFQNLNYLKSLQYKPLFYLCLSVTLFIFPEATSVTSFLGTLPEIFNAYERKYTNAHACTHTQIFNFYTNGSIQHILLCTIWLHVSISWMSLHISNRSTFYACYLHATSIIYFPLPGKLCGELKAHRN